MLLEINCEHKQYRNYNETEIQNSSLSKNDFTPFGRKTIYQIIWYNHKTTNRYVIRNNNNEKKTISW